MRSGLPGVTSRAEKTPLYGPRKRVVVATLADDANDGRTRSPARALRLPGLAGSGRLRCRGPVRRREGATPPDRSRCTALTIGGPDHPGSRRGVADFSLTARTAVTRRFVRCRRGSAMRSRRRMTAAAQGRASHCEGPPGCVRACSPSRSARARASRPPDRALTTARPVARALHLRERTRR